MNGITIWAVPTRHHHKWAEYGANAAVWPPNSTRSYIRGDLEAVTVWAASDR